MWKRLFVCLNRVNRAGNSQAQVNNIGADCTPKSPQRFLEIGRPQISSTSILYHEQTVRWFIRYLTPFTKTDLCSLK
jgi:hypothetical protein